MSGRTFHPDDGREGILGEETLLALIEGELAPEREREVLAAVSARPELLATLRAMRRQKILLSDVCEIEAPPEVLDGLEGAIERAALLGQPNFADLPPAPPAISTRGERRWASGALAMAAAVALLAGGLGYWSLTRGPAGRSGGPAGGEVARADRSPAVEATKLAAAAPEARPQAPGVEPKAGPSEVPETKVAAADTLENEARTPSEFVGPVILMETTAAYEPGAMTPERAVMLAAQGRLVVRVSSRSMTRTLDSMDAIAAAQRERSWRLSRETAEQRDDGVDVVRELAAKDERRAAAEARDRAVATEYAIPSAVAPAARQAGEKRAFFASVALTPEALASLRSTLGTDMNVEVTFDELAAPSQPSVELTDKGVLWWEETPSHWVAWADVPVIIETGD